MLAVLNVEDVWQPDREAEAKQVFGTTDPTHPGVGAPAQPEQPWSTSGGAIEGLQLPSHYDFTDLRRTPAELRGEFAKLGAGPRSSPSRPATRCTAPTSS